MNLRIKIQESEILQPLLDFSYRSNTINPLKRPYKAIRWIFIDLHPRGTITSDVLYDMYLSSIRNSRFETTYLNLANLDQSSQQRYLEHIISEPNITNLLIFEVHTNSEINSGRWGSEQILALRKKGSVKTLPVCFDIYREFDSKFIKYWESLSVAFLHVDEANAKKISISKPLIFWPFVLPSIDRISKHSDMDEFKHQNETLLFSGSVKSRERISTLLYLKVASLRYDFKVRVRVKDESQGDLDERALYLSELQSALAVVNLNFRTGNEHPLLTFRAIETIRVNGCLLDQKYVRSNSSLEKIAVPFKHFIPFDSVSDLIKISWCLNENPDIPNIIRGNCRQLLAENLSEDNLWKYLETMILDIC
jgi:hypothetical protein